jgi:hypothetical protein
LGITGTRFRTLDEHLHGSSNRFEGRLGLPVGRLEGIELLELEYWIRRSGPFLETQRFEQPRHCHSPPTLRPRLLVPSPRWDRLQDQGSVCARGEIPAAWGSPPTQQILFPFSLGHEFDLGLIKEGFSQVNQSRVSCFKNCNEFGLRFMKRRLGFDRCRNQGGPRSRRISLHPGDTRRRTADRTRQYLQSRVPTLMCLGSRHPRRRCSMPRFVDAPARRV